MNNNREDRRHHNEDIARIIKGSNRTICTIGAGNPKPESTEDGFNHNPLGLCTVRYIGGNHRSLTPKERKKEMQEFLRNKRWK